MSCRALLSSSVVALFCATALPLGAQPLSFNGFLGVEGRNFGETDLSPSQIGSIVGELRSRGDLSDRLSYDLRLYGRWNMGGVGGGYIDPTVAKLTWQSGNWQVDAGYDLLFWGVAEGRNLVNVINQRDQIRDLFFDQGLGQSMLAVRYFGPTLTFEGFVLPHFETLDFGAEGRPWGFGLPVNGDASTFESADGADHIDYALRVSGMTGDLEYAVFGFDGTLREPQYRLDSSTMTLIPHYRLGQQVGLEAQYTAGALLYKFEGVQVWPDSDEAYWSAILGVEYLHGDLFGKPWETSFFAEYYRDSRQDDPTVLFQNDVFLGTQIRFSNALDTKLEIGAIIDADYGGAIGSVNLESRITDNLRASFEYIFVDASDPDDGLFNAKDFDQASVSLVWHF